MPRQIDQLPTDATTMARKVRALEREVRELRAARRLTSATIGNVRTAADGGRVELAQSSQSVRVYAEDGVTVLAELGPQADGAGGLWTRGFQDPYNMATLLGAGTIVWRPVADGLIAVPASAYYDTDTAQYANLTFTSGSVADTDHRLLLILESVFAAGLPRAYFQGENSTLCGVDVLGTLTASNIVTGSVAITPSAANTPTSVTVSGLNVPGTVLRAFTTIANPAPGFTAATNGVTGSGYTNLTSSGMTVWATRQSTTAVTIIWGIIGTDI
ncbi:hypothetical protein [Streptomyces sp. NPDC096132]|uniref:hypothetical protein n=1 Tax=Streptomyces sp. NPDC096132 TaxID=3366075 RepID=UPI00381C7BD8